MTWLGATIAARVAAVELLALLARPAMQSFATVSGGDALYLLQRSIWMRNTVVGDPFAPIDYFEAYHSTYGWSGYNYVLAWFHVVFGPSPYAAHLLSTLLFFAAAGLLFRIVRARFGPRPAIIGLLVLTTLPTLFVWSMTPLKEAPYLLLASTALGGAAAAVRAGWSWRGTLAAVLAGVALLMIATVRGDAATLTAVGVAGGVAIWIAGRSRLGLAALAFTALAAVVIVANVPQATRAFQGAVRFASFRQIGHVLTTGHSFRLLNDEHYFDARPQTLPPDELVAFMVRAVVRFFTVPEPWIMRGRSELLLLPQQMLWYLLIGFGAFGVVAGMRRDRLLASLLVAFVAAGALLIGVNTVVPFAVWLSAMGAARQIERGPSRWFNRVDFWAAFFVLVMIPAGVVLYIAFRTPAPRLDAVEPQKVYAPGRVVLRGRHLRPYLHAYLVPHGQTLVLLDRHDRPSQAQYLIRTPNDVELELPALPPGIYDVALLENVELVARLDSAFAVVEVASAPVGVVVADGRFQNVDPRAASPSQGATIRQADGAVAAEVLEVGRDTPQIDGIGPGYVKTWARIEGRVQRPAVVKLRCQVAGNRCWYAGQAVVADGSIDLPFAGGTARFVVDAVRPDAASVAAFEAPMADAIVDFVTWPDMERLVKADDRDGGGAQSWPVHPARIARVMGAERFVGEAAIGTDPYGGHFTVQQPLVRIRAVVRFARQPSGALDWRNRPLRVGGRFTFETPAYALDGTIVGMAQ